MDADGKFSYVAALDDVLDGSGTSDLVVVGCPITINACATTDDDFAITGFTDVFDTADSVELNLLPGGTSGHGILVEGSIHGFSVEAAGLTSWSSNCLTV